MSAREAVARELARIYYRQSGEDKRIGEAYVNTAWDRMHGKDADRILQALGGEGWAKKLEPGQLSSTETIRLIIESWITQSTKECRESGFEPNGDTHIMRFSPHYVSHSQMQHWIRVISGIEEQRDALQRQLDALTSDAAVEAAAIAMRARNDYKRAWSETGATTMPQTWQELAKAAITAAIEAAQGPSVDEAIGAVL